MVVASGRIKCFEVGEQLLSLADAQAECERRGGNLASILSDAENQAAVALGSTGWLGASGGVSEGTWSWSDGSPWGFTKWADGEPNNELNEDCAELKGPGSLQTFWNDLPCDLLRNAICSRTIVLDGSCSECPANTHSAAGSDAITDCVCIAGYYVHAASLTCSG